MNRFYRGDRIRVKLRAKITVPIPFWHRLYKENASLNFFVEYWSQIWRHCLLTEVKFDKVRAVSLRVEILCS